MIRLKQVTLNDFGPFRRNQVLDLPDRDGVVVIYGDNGKGKTTLLNGLRFAFTGEVLNRGNVRRSLESLVNRDAAAADATAGCKVAIEFSNDEVDYLLTRSVVRTASGAVDELLLKRDGRLLNRSEAESELARILPPETQQFFFFDGELLDQFEGLLRNDSNAGDRLKASIERLLGVPIVTNATNDCELVLAGASELIADAAKRDSASQELGASLSQTNTLLGLAHQQVQDEDQHISTLETELEDIEQQMDEHARKVELLAQVQAKREELASLEVNRKVLDEQFAEELADGWKAVLAGPLEDRIRSKEQALLSTTGSRNRAAFAAELRAATAADGSTCPACGTKPLDHVHEQHLLLITSEADKLEQLDSKLMLLRTESQVLRDLHDPGSPERIKAAEKSLRSAHVAINDLKAAIAGLNDQLGATAEEGLKTLLRRRDDATKQVTAAKQARDAAVAEVATHTQQRDKFAKRIGNMAGVDVPPEVAVQQALSKRLAELMRDAVEEYRQSLLRGVETEATNLFVKMRSEVEFSGLRINENYGLQIVDDQGKLVPDRSAGYEHLVALALIGGLQACSTISGPVVMDSPFGRLDFNHTKQVTSNLNKLSPQVLLLVHAGEIDPHRAAELLESSLLVEFELVRHSSTDTEIRQMRAS